MPFDNIWVGFSGLNMCGPDGWKDAVEVCLPLLAAVNRTEFPDAEIELQGNNCSFARILFEHRPKPSYTCRPHNGIIIIIITNIGTYAHM